MLLANSPIEQCCGRLSRTHITEIHNHCQQLFFLMEITPANRVPSLTRWLMIFWRLLELYSAIKDAKAPKVLGLSIGEQSQISHYVAKKTGGQYFTAAAKDYAAALDMIFMQLHFRYELGFIPRTIDGRRHKLKVELTIEARAKHKEVRLRFHPEYIPVAEVPTWAR